MRTWQVQEARRHFRELFNAAAEQGPQRIVRRGKRVAVVLSEEEWRRLSDGVPSFGELLASCPIERKDLRPRRAARILHRQVFE
jgi:prevent-host-death family protein